MVPKDCYDVDTFRWLKSKWLYDQRVTYLSGDIVEEMGALRASVKTAKACFLFPGEVLCVLCVLLLLLLCCLNCLYQSKYIYIHTYM